MRKRPLAAGLENRGARGRGCADRDAAGGTVRQTWRKIREPESERRPSGSVQGPSAHSSHPKCRNSRSWPGGRRGPPGGAAGYGRLGFAASRRWTGRSAGPYWRVVDGDHAKPKRPAHGAGGFRRNLLHPSDQFRGRLRPAERPGGSQRGLAHPPAARIRLPRRVRSTVAGRRCRTDQTPIRRRQATPSRDFAR